MLEKPSDPLSKASEILRWVLESNADPVGNLIRLRLAGGYAGFDCRPSTYQG